METERLILRKAQMTDIDDIYKIRNSDFVLKYNAMKVLTYEQVKEYLQKHIQVEDVFYLELKENGRVIGEVALHKDELRYGVNARCLSYFLGEDYTGYGYMSEALRVIIQYAFYVLNIEVLSARVFKGNEASRILIEHLGFKKEGELRKCVKGYQDIVYDDMIYALFKEDYPFSI